MRADESAADLYEQQSELFDSLLQNPATKKQPKSSRAAHIKELDVKVAQLNRDYDAKKHAKKAKVHQKKVHAKVQKKTKASDTMPREMMFLQEDSSLSKKEKRAAHIKELDEKVAKLNRDYDAKKHANVQKKAKVHHKVHAKVQKKVHVKVQKKTKAS